MRVMSMFLTERARQGALASADPRPARPSVPDEPLRAIRRGAFAQWMERQQLITSGRTGATGTTDTPAQHRSGLLHEGS